MVLCDLVCALSFYDGAGGSQGVPFRTSMGTSTTPRRRAAMLVAASTNSRFVGTKRRYSEKQQQLQRSWFDPSATLERKGGKGAFIFPSFKTSHNAFGFLGDTQGAGFYDMHGTTLLFVIILLFPVQYMGKRFAVETRENIGSSSNNSKRTRTNRDKQPKANKWNETGCGEERYRPIFTPSRDVLSPPQLAEHETQGSGKHGVRGTRREGTATPDAATGPVGSVCEHP